MVADTSSVINKMVMVNLDTTRYNAKPTDDGKVVNETKRPETIIEIPLPSLLTAASVYGQTFTQGVMIGTKGEHWKQSQLLVHDLDNGNPNLPLVHLSDLLDLYIKHKLYPNAAYYTFSSKPEHPKARIFFLLDKVITDPKQFVELYRKSASIFQTTLVENTMPNGKTSWSTKAQIDLKCENLDRIFYGSNYGIIPEFSGQQITSIDDVMDIEPHPEHIRKRLTPQQEANQQYTKTTTTQRKNATFRALDFVADDGKQIKGSQLFVSFPDDSVSGERTERLFVKADVEIPANVKIGDVLDLSFNHRGKVESIVAAGK